MWASSKGNKTHSHANSQSSSGFHELHPEQSRRVPWAVQTVLLLVVSTEAISVPSSLKDWASLVSVGAEVPLQRKKKYLGLCGDENTSDKQALGHVARQSMGLVPLYFLS